MRTTLRLTILALVITFTTTGCSYLIRSTLRSAGNAIGDEIGRGIGEAVVADLSPMMEQLYIDTLFAMTFNSGGYHVQGKAYRVGEWTRWEVEGQDAGDWSERAYLGNDAKGNQWWRMTYFDAENDQTMVLEALISADYEEILRMRRLFPGDEGPQEIPVEEGTGFVPPRKLTDESLQGALVGRESITVPAGTFNARHHRFASGADGTWSWWLTDTVPGGVVKQAGSRSGGDSEWVINLAKFGTGAKSQLGSL